MGKGRGRGRDKSDTHFRNRQNPRTNQNRPKGKGKGRQQKGQSPDHPRTLGDRKPKEPCSYCGGTNHSARTCYKRQNDEKAEKGNKTHQQANLNIQIDEQALMFSQTVLTVFQSDTFPDPDTTRWGENETKETTDSDQNTESENDSGEDYEGWKEDPWYHSEGSKRSEQHAEPKQEEEGDTENKRTSLTKLTSNLEGSPNEIATKPNEQDANQSSSIEPTWGTWKKETRES